MAKKSKRLLKYLREYTPSEQQLLTYYLILISFAILFATAKGDVSLMKGAILFGFECVVGIIIGIYVIVRPILKKIKWIA